MSFNLTSHSVWYCNETIYVTRMSVNETCSEGRTVRYLSDVYRSEFCVKQEDISALFGFKLCYSVRHWGGLKCAVVYGIVEV